MEKNLVDFAHPNVKKRRCSASKSRPRKQLRKQQKQPSATSSNVQPAVNHPENQNNLAITETQFLSGQSDGNQLQLSISSLNDTIGSSSSNTLSDVKNTSSGITGMEYGELLGISYDFFEGLDVFEGVDGFDVAEKFHFIEDSSYPLSDLFRSYIWQGRPTPPEFDDFDFDKLFPNEERDNSEDANGKDPK